MTQDTNTSSADTNTSIINTLQEIDNAVQLLSNLESKPEVQQYLATLSKYKELEETARKYAETSLESITYYSPEDKSFVKIAPATKIKYSPTIESVKALPNGNAFIQIVEEVNLDMMKESTSPAVKDYLQSVASESIYSRKTKVKAEKLEENVF